MKFYDRNKMESNKTWESYISENFVATGEKQGKICLCISNKNMFISWVKTMGKVG